MKIFCTIFYINNFIFDIANGQLFLTRPYLTVMFRLRTPFTIPCLALHPNVVAKNDIDSKIGEVIICASIYLDTGLS